MAKLGFGLSAQTLANCGIDEAQIELDMASAIDIPNHWLPSHMRSGKSKTVNAGSLLKRIALHEQEQEQARAKQAVQSARADRLALYAQHVDAIEYSTLPRTIEDELRIDMAYVRCYADFVKLGILAPITHDELTEFEESQEDE